MGQVLVSGAVIQCKHKGQARIVGGDARLTVSGQGAITFGMETGISFAPGSPTVVAPCPFPDPKSGSPSPCVATLPATAGQATLLSIGGVPVLLDNAGGNATNPGDPSATWSVTSAGQNLLSSELSGGSCGMPILPAEVSARSDALAQYADALAAMQEPDWPADHGPADPYGRTFVLTDGDLLLARAADGALDLIPIAGKLELAQGIQVLVGTPLGSDIFNRLFGFDLINTLAQPVPLRQMRELVRLCVVKALAQEPRIRQIQAVAFADEPAFLTIHPEIDKQQQAALAQQQKTTRQWKLDVLLDTRLGDQVTAGIEGVGL